MSMLTSFAALLVAFSPASPSEPGRCSGDAFCRSCSNCKYCRHCSQEGGSCGVCAPAAPVRRIAPAPPKKRKVAKTYTVKTLPQEWTGLVVGVSDGDTVTVRFSRDGFQLPVKVRLHGVDAPETAQAFGTRAKQFTSDQVYRQWVTVQRKDTDRYGRLVGIVGYQGGSKVLNNELLKAGMGWWYKQYAPKESTLQTLEAAAKAGKVGLWSDAAPVAPWDFRRSR